MVYLTSILFRACFFLFVILLYTTGSQGICQSGSDRSDSAAYQPGIVIIKLKNQQNIRKAGPVHSLEEIASETGVQNVGKVFPGHRPSGSIAARVKQKEVASRYDTDLSRIYKLKVDPNKDIAEIIRQLLRYEEVAYAEPYYLMKPLAYVPNDPEANTESGAQKYLQTIKAYEAWEIEKGDTSMVIGILDTGVGLGHEDLDNLFYNHNDPINGSDDDGDGYTDNFLGWDMANDDNDPNADKDTHGTAVAGLAAATTDNETGIAGAGFRSKYLPIKIFKSEDNSFNNGYEAIVYAADQGCQVINLSWGGVGAYSQFAQDIINYAVLAKDAVVIAAAGNSGKLEYFFPASYNNVLSVTNSDVTDKKNPNATYNYLVDIIAPGTDVFTTKNDDLYLTTSGTSFSAPLVAGAAALVRAKYPELTANQVMERIRLSADNIYKTGSNSNFSEQLGFGRLNMKKALEELQTPALRMLQFSYDNGLGRYAMKGDTLSISVDVTNYLKQSSTLASVTLSAASPYVNLLDSVLQIGAVDTFAVVSNQNQPFRVVLSEDLPLDEELVFRLGFTDETHNYTDFQYFWINATSDYLDLDINKSRLTIGSNGNIGFNPEISNEAGFTYKTQQLASELGLVLAASQDSVSDNTIINFTGGDRSVDFTKLADLQLGKAQTAGIQATSAFADEGADNPMNLRIEQAVLGNENENYFIAHYRVINTGEDTLRNLQTALFSDWNLNDPEKNKAAWDNSHQMGYAYDAVNNNLFAGIALLTAQAPAYYAIDKDSLNGNVIDFSGDFVDSLKYNFLKNGIAKTEAGTAGAGNDVAHLTGAIIDSLPKNAVAQVAFAIIGGESLEELQEAANEAKTAYINYLKNPVPLAAVKICSDSTATVTPPEGENFRFYQDPLMNTFLQEGNSFTTGPITKDSAVYVTNIDAGYESTVRRFDINISEPEAKFSVIADANAGFLNDTLFLDETENFSLPLQDESLNTVQWQWNFDNGFGSTLQHPKPRFTEKGKYTITLTVTSEPGCETEVTKEITVVRRSPRPLIADAHLCEGETVSLSASNATQLQIFADESLETLVMEGNNFTLGPFAIDTSFFVVNTDSVYQSLPQKVEITVDEAGFDYSVTIDTLDLEEKYMLRLKGTGNLPDDRIFTWFANGDSIGQGTSLLYNYASLLSEPGIEISFRAETDKSCTYNVNHTFSLVPGPAPSLSVEKPCPGGSIGIQPEGGEVFYFYADDELQNLLHKGSRFSFENLHTDTVIYITNVDSLQESEPLTVPILLDNFAGFTMSADTIRLNETDTVRFLAFTTNPNETRDITWQWDFGNGNTAEVPAVVQQFDTTGVYLIQLTAQAEDACKNIVEKTLVVENIASLEEEELMEKATVLYPNPTDNAFTIENPHWRYKPLTITITTLQGQKLWKDEVYYRTYPLKFDIEQQLGKKLHIGTYLVHIASKDHQIIRKLIVRP